MGTGEFIAGGNPAMDYHPIQGGVEILLVPSCYGNRDKLRPDGPLGSIADFTLFLIPGVNKKTNKQTNKQKMGSSLSKREKLNTCFEKGCLTKA